MERVGNAIPTATPTLSAMPDLDMALPTWPDIYGHRKPKMSATKPEMETGSGNNYERKELAMRFQRLPHIFDHARVRNGTADIARHQTPEVSATEPEVETRSENRKSK